MTGARSKKTNVSRMVFRAGGYCWVGGDISAHGNDAGMLDRVAIFSDTAGYK